MKLRKRPALAVEGVVRKRGEGGGLRTEARRAVANCCSLSASTSARRVVVRDNSLGEVRHRETRNAGKCGRITHSEQMIQLSSPATGGLFVERLDGRGFSAHKAGVMTCLFEGFT